MEIASVEALRGWLSANHHRSDSVWLVLWKTGQPGHVRQGDVVDVALCFGWIDSLPRRLDEKRWKLRLTRRRPGSAWSGVNKRRLEALLAAGLVAEPGLRAIERAKVDGSWSLLDSASALAVPDDLEAAFETGPSAARAAFDGFPPSAKRAILEWVVQARRPETRARRVAETVACAAEGKRANAWARAAESAAR